MESAPRQWFIFKDGQQYGPVSADEVHQFEKEGRIEATDHVWAEGFQDWVMLKDVPELVASQPAAPPIPPRPVLPSRVNTHAAVGDGSIGEANQRAERYRRGATDTGGGAASGSTAHAASPWQAQAHDRDALERRTDNQAIVPQFDDTTTVLIAYILLVIPMFLLPVIGVVIAFANKGKGATWIDSHYVWQIRTFFIGLLISVVGALTTFILIGVVILLAGFIWYVVRIVKGISALNRREAIPDPLTWLW